MLDDKATGTVDYPGFRKALHDFQLGLSDDDIQALFTEFDISTSGTIDYDEFLLIVRVYLLSTLFLRAR